MNVDNKNVDVITDKFYFSSCIKYFDTFNTTFSSNYTVFVINFEHVNFEQVLALYIWFNPFFPTLQSYISWKY